MEIMNIDNLGNQLNYLENTKSLIMNSLIEKGQDINSDSTFRSYIDSIDRLSNVRKFNTLDDMNTDPNPKENDLALVYGPYREVKENEDITCLYFPKKINITKSQIQSLPDQTILGYIMDKANPNIEIMRAYINNNDIVIAFQDSEIYSTNIIYRPDENNIYTRADSSNNYLKIPISDVYDIKYDQIATWYTGDPFFYENGYYRTPVITVTSVYTIGAIRFHCRKDMNVKLDYKVNQTNGGGYSLIGNVNQILVKQTAEDSERKEYFTTSSENSTIYNNLTKNSEYFIQFKHATAWNYYDSNNYIGIKISNESVNYRNISSNYFNIFSHIFLINGLDNDFVGLYTYNNNWNLLDELKTNAKAEDIWLNTAWTNGQKVNGTLHITSGINREDLNKKLYIWKTFSNLSPSINDLSYIFNGFTHQALPNLEVTDIVNAAGIFNNCSNVKNINLYGMNFINSVNMDNTFNNCSNLTGVGIGRFLNAHNLKTMRHTFMNCKSIESIDFSYWNMGNLTNTTSMFENCINLKTLNLSNWNIVNLRDTTRMFENCKNLTNLNINNWNTSNLQYTSAMFKNCQNMENISFGRWNTINITNMEAIFESCDKFTNSSLANIVNMLPDATQLTNNNAYNLGIDMGRYNSSQLLILNQKNYIGAPLPFNMYYNITNLDDRTYYLLNKGDDLDKPGTKLRSYINNIYNNGIINISIEDNNLKEATIINLDHLFHNKYNIKSIDLSNLNIKNMNSAYCTFNNCYNLTNLNLDNWDVSNLRNPGCMFAACNNLTNLNISNWNTSNFTSLTWMFQGCSNLKVLDLNNWDVSNVTSWWMVFSGCRGLTDLNLKNWNLGPISAGSATNIFTLCYNLTNLDVSNWNTSNLQNGFGMFSECYSLTNLDVSNWNTSNLVNISNMFFNCFNLQNLDVSNWNTSNIINMRSLFYNCKNLTNLDLSSWDMSNVTNISSIFAGCRNLTNLNLSNWNLNKITSIAGLFSFLNNLVNLNITKWDTSKIELAYSIFAGCANLTNLNLSNWNTSNFKSLYSMFNGCTNLTNLNLSNWNTSNTTNLSGTFTGCSNLKVLDLNNWDVSNVTDIGSVSPRTSSGHNSCFYNCRSITNLNLTNWNLHKVKSFVALFGYCQNLRNLDLSNWNTSNVIDISYMFYECRNLSNESIDSIINMCLNAANVTYKNLMINNQYSPFNATNITNDRYQNRWTELDAAGWTY